jgi:hypothetical protein
MTAQPVDTQSFALDAFIQQKKINQLKDRVRKEERKLHDMIKQHGRIYSQKITHNGKIFKISTSTSYYDPCIKIEEVGSIKDIQELIQSAQQ